MDPATERIAALCAGLTNYERDRPDRIRFGLETMQRLLARPGAPIVPPRLIQVGGSKGKGTTARYVAALAREAGATTGVYLSPHAQTVLERVRIGDELVDEASLTHELRAVLEYSVAERLDVSFYEVMTAAALGCFAASGVEVGVLEVGLGGRLDATTAVPVDASILTSVELEHTELLGDTIEAIAREKVAIFRPGRPAITAVGGVALDVAKQRVADVGGSLRVLGSDFAVEAIETRRDRVLAVRLRDGDATAEIEVAGAPHYEATALALAWSCLRSLDPSTRLPPRLVRPQSPCCFEVVEPGPFVLDGAHTPGSARLLRAELDRRFDPSVPRTLLFGVATGKRWQEILALLAPGVETVFVTELSGTKSAPVGPQCAWLQAQGIRAEPVAGAAEGLARLRQAAGVRIVSGSFYLAGEVRSMLSADPT